MLLAVFLISLPILLNDCLKFLKLSFAPSKSPLNAFVITDPPIKKVSIKFEKVLFIASKDCLKILGKISPIALKAAFIFISPVCKNVKNSLTLVKVS